jgi:PAS domain S-box-containing protein
LEKFSWQSDQGYRILIDHLQDGVVVVEEGVLVFANQRMGSMIGYSTDELIGRPFIQFIAPGDAPLMQERYLARLAGETVPDQYDIHLVTAQGSLLFCTLNIGLYQDPNGKAVTIGSARDVTRQKTALAELEASKEELKKIFDRLPDVFYRTDMQGMITMISPSCFDILGYRQEVMQGTPMASYYVRPSQMVAAGQRKWKPDYGTRTAPPCGFRPTPLFVTERMDNHSS